MKPSLSVFILLALIAYGSCGNAGGQETASTESKTASSSGAAQLRAAWENTVRPVLSKNCLECHSDSEHAGKLHMETIAGLIRGGLSGSAIDLRDPASSLLLEVLSPQAKKHMPPDGQLTEEEIGLIKNWVESLKQESLPKEWLSNAAQHPDQGTASEKSNDPISALPLGLNPSQVIDLALESAWRENKLKPAGVANDAAFARRLYLDLVGRIPLESELTLFVSNTDSRKREQLVDSLLASAEHAQHMAEVLNAVLMGRKGPEHKSLDKGGSGKGGRDKGGRDKTGWMEFLTSAIQKQPAVE